MSADGRWKLARGASELWIGAGQSVGLKSDNDHI